MRPQWSRHLSQPYITPFSWTALSSRQKNGEQISKNELILLGSVINRLFHYISPFFFYSISIFFYQIKS